MFCSGLSLLSRLPIVQSSQRRNSFVPSRFQHQDQRHGRQENKRGHGRRKQPEKLKSGIYYVDDPYATFRDENELALRRSLAQERVSDSDYDYFYEDYKDQREFDRRGNSPINQAVKFVPVSQISTPPTITTTEKPYGEIVNKDFYDELSAARQIQPLHPDSQRAPLKSARKVSVESGEQNTAYPLGNPYYNYYYNTPSQPARLQGVFGPPVPQLPHQVGLSLPHSLIASVSSLQWIVCHFAKCFRQGYQHWLLAEFPCFKVLKLTKITGKFLLQCQSAWWEQPHQQLVAGRPRVLFQQRDGVRQ